MVNGFIPWLKEAVYLGKTDDLISSVVMSPI